MAREQSVGIVLREHRVEWTALQRGKGLTSPVGSGSLDLPVSAPGATAEEKAGVEAERGLTLKSAAGRLRGSISATVPTSHVLLRVVDLPTLVDAELKDMVDLQVDKFSPFPLESLAVSYEVLHRSSDSTIVVIAACQETAIDGLEKTLTEAGIMASRMDVATLGWCRLLQDGGEIPEEGRHLLVILDEGASPDLIWFEDGVPRVFRSLAGLESLKGAELEEEIVSEINFSLLSLDLEQGSGTGSTITIWHAGDDPGALATRMADGLLHKVSAKPLSSLPSLSEGIARRGTARGAVVDLTPAEWQSSRQSRQQKKKLLWILLGLVGVWLLAVGSLEGWISVKKLRLQHLVKQREELAGPAAEVKEMRRRVVLVQGYMNQQESALETLREIVLMLPAGVELRSFSYQKEEGIKISGAASEVSQVYRFKTKLDASNMFVESTLIGPREAKDGKQLFDIDIKLKGTA